MRIKAAGVTLFGLGAVLAAGGSGPALAESPHDTLTEWTVPFADTTPLWVAAAGDSIVFTTFDVVEVVGRLDPGSGSMTRWPLPYLSATPGDLKVRSSDGAVFLTAVVEGELGQFDPQTGVLRRWQLPVAVGPLALAIEPDGTVLFLASDVSGNGEVGRLNTTTGALDTWLIPDSTQMFLWQLAPGPQQTVFLNFSGFGPDGILRLDMASGVFTTWSTSPTEPIYSITTDAQGRVYFEENNASAWSIARLVPETGALTEWQTSPNVQDRIVLFGNEVLFGDLGPSGLNALDVTHPGRQSIVSASPATQAVIPVSVQLTPVDDPLAGETAQAPAQSSDVRRRHKAAFDLWPVAGQPHAVAVAGTTPAFYFSESDQPAIGRITP